MQSGGVVLVRETTGGPRLPSEIRGAYPCSLRGPRCSSLPRTALPLHPFRLKSLLVVVVCCLAGCRVPGWAGSSSRSLVASRQLSQQGVAALERGEWQEAEAMFAQGLKVCPQDPDARRYYAETLWHRGAREEAVAHLLDAGQQAPDNAAIRARIAEMQLELGQVNLALQTVQHALDLDPKLATAWAVRGRIKQAQGQLRESLSDLHRALDCDPSDRDIQLEIADLYRRLDQPQRALIALQSLADSYPPGEEPQQVLFLQGLAYSALSRYEDAAETLSAASTRGEPNAEILCRLGEAELLAGRPSRAAAAAREALGLAPAHQASRELLGRVELAMLRGGLR